MPTAEIFEITMIICFGLSWPMSIMRSLKSKSTKGKSVVFLFLILLGYLAGIISKFAGGQPNLATIFYVINFLMVGADIIIYFRNRKIEKTIKEEEKKNVL